MKSEDVTGRLYVERATEPSVYFPEGQLGDQILRRLDDFGVSAEELTRPQSVETALAG